jgi:hypothetical protein
MGKDELRYWMNENGINSRKLALVLGVSHSLVYAWLNGGRIIPHWLSYALIGVISQGIKDNLDA